MTRLAYRLTGGPNEFSIDKAKRLLGYEPPVGFDRAMDELGQYYRGASERG